MRILANYGYKTSDESFTVTFESLGDIPKDIANQVVDDLFAMAKAAIQRQLNPEVKVDDAPPKEEVVVMPDPTNGNGKKDNGKHGNGNGGKYAMKDPDSPMTPKQRALLEKLLLERGQSVDGIGELSKEDAAYVIEDLLSVAA